MRSVLEEQTPPKTPRSKELTFIVDLTASGTAGLCVEVATPTSPNALRSAQKKHREIALWQPVPVTQALIDAQTDPADVAALTTLLGASSGAGPFTSYSYLQSGLSRFWLSRAAREVIPPILARTGHLRLRRSPEERDPPTLLWDDGEPWQLHLEARLGTRDPDADEWEIVGSFQRGEAKLPFERAEVLFEGGLMILEGTLTRFNDNGAWPWLDLLHRHGRFRVPADQQRAFLEQVYTLPELPPLELPEGRALLEVAPTPTPRLRVFPPDKDKPRARGVIQAALEMEYDRLSLWSRRPGRIAFDAERRRLVRRDPEAEAGAREKLLTLGWTPVAASAAGDKGERADLQIPVKRFAAAVHDLVTSGWTVEAEGKLYRRPGEFKLELTSGIDWFDLHATCDFEGVPANLPALLEALRRGEKMVVLDDGSLGVLPEEWLSRYGVLANLGTAHDGEIRFKRSQVGLLDLLLAAEPEVSVDAVFAKARAELQSFRAIEPEDAPASFQGELRGYQREGLGWLMFLHRFGFGGCLADEMGLGKTVQVLALLAARKENKEKEPARLPALVIAPRSLIFNWKSEATRFTPTLRVLDHTGSARLAPGEHFESFDVVLTTYGTLRRDAIALSKVRFDYIILDEAQAIKNDRSLAAKAARLLQADHRLALSGTPVENHLGELWSLFEFLNPGMLGRASMFNGLTGAGRSLDREAIGLLVRALRPFVLRRTKAEVAKELPARLEQTRLLDLEPRQRHRYDELRRYFQASLKKRVATEGIEKSKIHVLEALLRLRQAACHPGLIDPKLRGESSAKLDALLGELSSLRESGQKALVFSQFTSMLGIVRERLDQEGIIYEYLDGQTRDRGARVERFQTDPGCSVFLISLKAGGLGLNLTAAEYVFLLDPWWNPAAEAQAIDRAHRIGQARAVFAYRLIARDTIEERIVELSQKKRELAESVITGDGSPLRDLTAEDLELLLS